MEIFWKEIRNTMKKITFIYPISINTQNEGRFFSKEENQNHSTLSVSDYLLKKTSFFFKEYH